MRSLPGDCCQHPARQVRAVGHGQQATDQGEEHVVLHQERLHGRLCSLSRRNQPDAARQASGLRRTAARAAIVTGSAGCTRRMRAACDCPRLPGASSATSPADAARGARLRPRRRASRSAAAPRPGGRPPAAPAAAGGSCSAAAAGAAAPCLHERHAQLREVAPERFQLVGLGRAAPSRSTMPASASIASRACSRSACSGLAIPILMAAWLASITAVCDEQVARAQLQELLRRQLPRERRRRRPLVLVVSASVPPPVRSTAHRPIRA